MPAIRLPVQCERVEIQLNFSVENEIVLNRFAQLFRDQSNMKMMVFMKKMCNLAICVKCTRRARIHAHDKPNARKSYIEQKSVGDKRASTHRIHGHTFSFIHSLQKCHWIDERKQNTRAQDMSLKVFPVSQFQFDFIFLVLHSFSSCHLPSLSPSPSLCADVNRCTDAGD